MRIGFDLDNTIICYDEAFANALATRYPAMLEGRSARSFAKKEDVKAFLQRQGEAGERAWRALQGSVYGRGIGGAALFAGVVSALAVLHAQGHTLFVVSHKTEYGHFDASRTNLREAAVAFLEAHGVTRFIPRERIFFGATLAEKLAKIGEIGCEVFVDDLTEVLLHRDFPAATRRVAFRARRVEGAPCGYVREWGEIAGVVSGAAEGRADCRKI